MTESFNWKCPYCSKSTTIVKSTNFSQDTHYLYRENGIDGPIALITNIVICPNQECKQYVIEAYLFPYNVTPSGREINYQNRLGYWRIKPDSSSIPQPDYIPEQIRNDYYEACKISEDSPKASATLARRCLQGMIRDFWRISKSRLVDEISELEDKIDSITWKAIDSLRKLGNIGAHMEKDINMIVDVDENEARLLISLIEDLLHDWYVIEHEKQERYSRLVEIAESK